MAWADGSVSTAEERRVLEIASERGITSDSHSYEFLRRLLNEKPADLFFERTNRVIAHLVSSEGEGADAWMRKSLPQLCQEVAKASGGFFGLGDPVSEDERVLIERLSRELGTDAATGERLGKKSP